MVSVSSGGVVALRLTGHQRRTLVALGLKYVVYIAKDVSVIVPGHMESAFTRKEDAEKEAERLSTIYGEPGSFAVEVLGPANRSLGN